MVLNLFCGLFQSTLEYFFSFSFRKFALHATPTNPPRAPITTIHFCNVLKKNYPAMAPCRFFAAGKCFYGTSCRNSHIYAPPDYTIPPNSESRQNVSQNSPQLSTTNNSVPSKTLCWFFTQGKCRYGTTCKNSHDIQPQSGLPFHQILTTTTYSPTNDVETEVRALSTETISQTNTLQSDTPSWHAQATGEERTRSRFPCIFFARGCCQNGKECNFLHEKLGAVDGIPGGKEDNQQQEVST